MKLHVLGAARQVTGSRYLLETAGMKVLVDCGLYQERPYLDRNWEPFPVPPDEIDILLLSHAHLDHSGYIPRLVKEGFSRKILATGPSIELAEIVLLDTAHIQEEDAAFKLKRHKREGRIGPHPEIPLYTVEEARRSFAAFETVSYLQPIRLNDGLTVRFHDAGHILGSSMLSLEVRENGRPRRIIFSGDIGQWDHPLVQDPTVFDSADIVVMESTYGDRIHDDPAGINVMLERIIKETISLGGNVLIPVFALERAQELLFYLGNLIRAGRVPRLPVFLDSPMAVEVTKVFARYPAYLDPEAVRALQSGRQPFDFPGLKVITSIEESKAANNVKGPCVIMAGSGMCTGGRIKHHLSLNIQRPESTVLFVGYQAAGTLGRQILEKRPEVRINGRIFRTKARIAQIQGFSGHADRNDLLRWLGTFKTAPGRLFLTHGEEAASLSLAAFLEKEKRWTVTVPRYEETFDL
ncbi:MAG: MBL fold metallo-hydrolase [Candidatus Aminicenantes bacterium]|nr:MBL fold metallo-hydrolase [Candidatus Aminicenantes bacterium]